MTAGWSQRSAALFIVTEAFAWFIALRAFATAIEREAFRSLEDDLLLGTGVRELTDQQRAQTALAVAHQGAEHATAGPALLLVLLAAGGAFLLARSIARWRMPAGISAAAGVLASIVALQVLLHIALAGDLRVWSGSGMAQMFEGSGGLGGRIATDAFIANPDPDGVRRASAALTTVGMFALWIRFLLAGRGAVTFEKVLRSFSIGFAVVLVAALVWGSVAGSQTGAALALAYFVLGVLSLAVAHAARTGTEGDVVQREGPWAISVLVTLGAVGALALLFAAFAALDVQRVFEPAALGLFAVVEWVLKLVLAPVFFGINWLLNLLLGDATAANFRGGLRDLTTNQPQPDQTHDRPGLPGWVSHGLRVALMALAVWIAYRLGKLVFGRMHGQRDEAYAESRGASSGGGLGDMLRGIFPARGGRGADPTAWMRRHAVYRLFGRAVVTAEDRGLERRPGQTPIEFADVAGRRLGPGATPFAPIASAFDRARYGRHYPEENEVDSLGRALSEWERSHPEP